MMKPLSGLILSWLLITTLYGAPFEAGDASQGEKLSKKSCEACHVARFGGDGSKVYTRPDRMVKNPDQLIARIATCNTNSGANLFPEEEVHIAAYLNQQYYKFK